MERSCPTLRRLHAARVIGSIVLVIFASMNAGVTGFEASSITSVGGVSVHRAPLRYSDPDSVYTFAASNIQDIAGNFLATQVWPSARTAALELERNPQFVTGQTVCEFGCGPGLPSLTAAKLGASYVYATDLDPFGLQLVDRAAQEQGLDTVLTTREFDLVNSYTDEIPMVDLYILSDVFECQEVAVDAARVCAEILQRGTTAFVWVFAQSDRAQRDDFLCELQRLLEDPSLEWTRSALLKKQGEANEKDTFADVFQFNNNLWLCDIDESNVFYG